MSMRIARPHPTRVGASLGNMIFRTAAILSARNGGLLASAKAAALALAMSIILVDPGAADAQVPSLPDVGRPFAGDPRLEPIPDGPVHLVNFDVFADGKVVTMRFPPRVNGQTA